MADIETTAQDATDPQVADIPATQEEQPTDAPRSVRGSQAQLNQPASVHASQRSLHASASALNADQQQYSLSKEGATRTSAGGLAGAVGSARGSQAQLAAQAAAAAPVETAPKKAAPQYISEDAEVDQVKAFLMKTSPSSNMNLYDHLTACLMHIIEQRPDNAVDIFENLSAEMKLQKFRTAQDALPLGHKVAKLPDEHLDLANTHLSLMQTNKIENEDSAAQGEIPDILDLSHLFEWAGLSFGSEETYLLALAIKSLVNEKHLKSVRLFGKIFGTQKSYFIVESETTPETPAYEDPAEVAAKEAEAKKEEEAAANNAEGQDAAATTEAPKPVDPLDPLQGLNPESNAEQLSLLQELPKSKFQQPPAIPKENEAGTNKYVYWVCHYAGGPWVRLPDAKPEFVHQSRLIRKYFTGDLSTKIVSYPPFKGTEADLLRSQIARISAATVISPAGYYTFESEEENEESEGSALVIMNPDFEGQTHDQLLLPGNWVHHVSYILPQGRTTWVNPTLLNKDGSEKEQGEGSEAGEEDEDNESGAVAAEPETGPAVLTPIAQDEELEANLPSWSIRLASTLIPVKYSPVIVRSNRWPGAVTIGYRDKFANLYVGDGLKDSFHQPAAVLPLPAVQGEYGIAHEKDDAGQTVVVFPTDVVEQVDPTLAEEKAFEEATKAKDAEEKEGSEGEEEQEEEEEEEDA